MNESKLRWWLRQWTRDGVIHLHQFYRASDGMPDWRVVVSRTSLCCTERCLLVPVEKEEDSDRSD